MQKLQQPSFIITVGASAGGLNAVSELVAQLPEDLDAAVFVVLHLSNVGLGEFLITRLQKHTSFICLIPKDGDEIEAGRIYLAPPNTHLLIRDGRAGLAHGPAENRWRPSIDVLFRSAAAHYGNRVIGIILTGYLNDGVAGMGAIKKGNGYCIVQDPNQAEYPDMPLSVLEEMEVNHCVPLGEMGSIIEEIVTNGRPEPAEIDAQVIKEARIAENTITSIDAVAELGEKSTFACPDCGGGLWNVNDSPTKSYRCHVGHVFTEKNLVVQQAQSLESTLWVALRMMEERRMLLKKIGENEKNKGFVRMAKGHLKQSEELEDHISKLKALLFETKKEATL